MENIRNGKEGNSKGKSKKVKLTKQERQDLRVAKEKLESGMAGNSHIKDLIRFYQREYKEECLEGLLGYLKDWQYQNMNEIDFAYSQIREIEAKEKVKS